MSWYFGGIFMKKKSGKLSTLEKNRTSIMTDNVMLKKQLISMKYFLDVIDKIKYGLVMPLCYRCHLMMHRNAVWQEIWH